MTERWYQAGEALGWHKKDSAEIRRGAALKARDGDELAAAHALQALANVTKDPETKERARADALYFFKLHKQRSRRFK